MNLLSIAKNFATEDQALDHLVKYRWPDGVRCLACDHPKVYRIDTKGKTGKPCRLYECAECGLHFSVITGTLVPRFAPAVAEVVHDDGPDV
jgi:transposase-like protein